MVAVVALLTCTVGALAACAPDDDIAEDVTEGSAIELTIDDVWARTSPAMVTDGVAYATITSPVDDQLLTASVDPTIAGRVELRRTTLVDMVGTAAPAMETSEVEGIELLAGQTVALTPGSFHVVLLDLVRPLTTDQTFAMTLQFQIAGAREVTVTVRDDAP